VHHRYQGKKARPDDCVANHLLDEAQCEAALRLGLALRLGAALSGRSAQILSDFELDRSEGSLVLTANRSAGALVVERALQRFEQLASALSLTPEVR
jgi:exopolyphosphatase/guanosine-5'-triphosphate,3'-diphosphate pyrophosphatase